MEWSGRPIAYSHHEIRFTTQVDLLLLVLIDGKCSRQVLSDLRFDMVSKVTIAKIALNQSLFIFLCGQGPIVPVEAYHGSLFIFISSSLTPMVAKYCAWIST